MDYYTSDGSNLKIHKALGKLLWLYKFAIVSVIVEFIPSPYNILNILLNGLYQAFSGLAGWENSAFQLDKIGYFLFFGFIPVMIAIEEHRLKRKEISDTIDAIIRFYKK